MKSTPSNLILILISSPLCHRAEREREPTYPFTSRHHGRKFCTYAAHSDDPSLIDHISPSSVLALLVLISPTLSSIAMMAPLASMIKVCDSFHERFSSSLNLDHDAPPQKTLKKRVRFNRETRNINSRKEFYNDEDIETKWFTGDELLQIRNEAKAFSALLRRGVSPDACDLTLAYKKTSLILSSDFKPLMELGPAGPDRHLQMGWCSHSDGRRGLERFSSREVCNQRRNDIIATRKAVLEEQSLQRDRGCFDDEAIARIARGISRRARTFAHFLGAADAKQSRIRDKPPQDYGEPLGRKRCKTAHDRQDGASF